MTWYHKPCQGSAAAIVHIVLLHLKCLCTHTRQSYAVVHMLTPSTRCKAVLLASADTIYNTTFWPPNRHVFCFCQGRRLRDGAIHIVRTNHKPHHEHKPMQRLLSRISVRFDACLSSDPAYPTGDVAMLVMRVWRKFFERGLDTTSPGIKAKTEKYRARHDKLRKQLRTLVAEIMVTASSQGHCKQTLRAE
jgi:hypothetical protein